MNAHQLVKQKQAELFNKQQDNNGEIKHRFNNPDKSSGKENNTMNTTSNSTATATGNNNEYTLEYFKNLIIRILNFRNDINIMSTILAIVTVLLFPIVVIQGLYVQKKTPKMPEPTGDRSGKINDDGGNEKSSISIAILGDSAAAGVGVERQDQALLGGLIKQLKSNYIIDYHLHAKSGSTTDGLIKSLDRMKITQSDVVIVSIGVNDIVQLASPLKWIAKQDKLYKEIQKRLQPKLIIATAIPPMHLFPALPKPLSIILGQYAMTFNQALATFVKQHPNMELVDFDITSCQAQGFQMASDGFHPSEPIYNVWATEVTKKIQLHREKFVLTSEIIAETETPS